MVRCLDVKSAGYNVQAQVIEMREKQLNFVAVLMRLTPLYAVYLRLQGTLVFIFPFLLEILGLKRFLLFCITRCIVYIQLQSVRYFL